LIESCTTTETRRSAYRSQRESLRHPSKTVEIAASSGKKRARVKSVALDPPQLSRKSLEWLDIRDFTRFCAGHQPLEITVFARPFPCNAFIDN
jgi:hypothetical protein